MYMPLYTSLDNLLDVLAQIANRMGLQNKNKNVLFRVIARAKCLSIVATVPASWLGQ
jgi:hypothetical protein